MVKTSLDVADYITPLLINGMEGRLLRAPATKNANQEILLVYGHHALLERWWGLVENLQEFGNVTMPDLPGFGGMDSFYKIHRKPTLDEYADYLAAFVKMRYRHKRVTVVGISFGFNIVTRMLQRYPELAKKVTLVISIVGFMHKTDFTFSPRRRAQIRLLARVFSWPVISWVIRYGGLNGFVIKQLYIRLPAGRRRFLEMDPITFANVMDFELKLWQRNDVRTHWRTTSDFMMLDNCQQQIDLPVYHISSKTDYYFNNDIVEQHMLVVFNDYRRGVMNSHAHTPSVLGDKKELSVMLPSAIRKILRQQANN